MLIVKYQFLPNCQLSQTSFLVAPYPDPRHFLTRPNLSPDPTSRQTPHNPSRTLTKILSASVWISALYRRYLVRFGTGGPPVPSVLVWGFCGVPPRLLKRKLRQCSPVNRCRFLVHKGRVTEHTVRSWVHGFNYILTNNENGEEVESHTRNMHWPSEKCETCRATDTLVPKL